MACIDPRSFGRSRWRCLGAGALVLSALVAAGCLPDKNGVFHGCVSKADQQLRVIDTENNQACTSNEIAISWSQKGVKGDPGPPGPVKPWLVGGSATFVDKAELTGFIGASGLPGVAAGANDVPFPISNAATMSGFSGSKQTGGAAITFTLLKNGAATALSCTVASAATSCTDPDSVTVTATDLLVVKVTHPAGAFDRYVRWSANVLPS